jgi:hypothetical protein
VSILAIILIVVAALVLLLLIGGLVGNARKRRSDDAKLERQLREANEALAQAHAQDKGWAREALEGAARAAFGQSSSQEIDELHLVQVVDRPGTDADEAVFRVVTADGSQIVHLARSGDSWLAR